MYNMIVEAFLVEEDVVFLSCIRWRCAEGRSIRIHRGFLGEVPRLWLPWLRSGVYS